MLRLWEVLSELYGHKFISQYGEDPSDVWATALENISLENIKRGIDRLPDRKDEWPPTAIEFFNLCRKPTISPDGTNGAAYLPLVSEQERQQERIRLTDQGGRERAESARDCEMETLRKLFTA